jgi:dipeptidyl aminopeptidase/acylaminoacyl peptidase
MRPWPFLIVLLAPLAGSGQTTPPPLDRYRRPTPNIESAALAPWYQNVSLGAVNSSGDAFLISRGSGPVSISVLAKPYTRLGGVAIDVGAARAREITTSNLAGIEIQELFPSQRIRVELPPGSRARSPAWSPDGRRIAFWEVTETATYLRVADRQGKSRRVTDRAALPILYTGFEWAGNDALIFAVRPKDWKAPTRLGDAVQPRVNVSDDKPNRLRVFASIMRTSGEFDEFRRWGTSQLARVSLDGKITELGAPDLWRSVDASPDGAALRAVAIAGEFSSAVPVSSYGTREVILDAGGKELVELRRTPVRFGIEPDAAPERNPFRNLAWAPEGRELYYLSEPAGTGPNRGDRVMRWPYPYEKDKALAVYTAPQRIGGFQFGARPEVLFLNQTIESKPRLSYVALPDGKPVTLAEWTTDPPGQAVSLVSSADRRVRTQGGAVYLSGTEYAADPRAQSPRPFVDRVTLADGKRERLWQSAADRFETVTFLNDSADRRLVQRQSAAEPNQIHLWDRGQERVLTENRDYAPDLTQATERRIVVTRADGIKFSVTVTLPPFAYRSPAYFYFYPTEFADQKAIDNASRTYNRNQFRPVGGLNRAIFLRAGYALVEPECPIVGPSGRQNDTFVHQLRMNLSAVIDALDQEALIDRRRLALGGHSYGAFGTLNAMVHTPYFRAGIAGAGNYNRLLTPFGFQNENRQLWDSRDVYLSMSPLMFANQLTGAVLLYHGADDQNMGTAPTHSERLFDTLEALGKPATLVMYPYEDHGQVARETQLDMWARWIEWLDQYLKDSPTSPAPAPAAAARAG